VLLALLIGLLAGLGLALALERFDTRIRNRRAAEERFGLPVLAEIPAISRRRRKGVVTALYPISRAADAFRLLSVGIARWSPEKGHSSGNGKPAVRPPAPRTILVTSAEPREGKTTVAANLAAAYAEVGNKVLVLSCDLRRPAIHKVLGVADRPGLTEALAATNGRVKGDRHLADLEPYLEPSSVSSVSVLPSGVASDRPGELLGSGKMQRLIRGVEQMADVVVIDSAPLLVASDVAPLLPQADAVLLVARAGKTRGEIATRAAYLLQRLGAPVVGVALNDARGFSASFYRRRFYRPTRGRSKAAKKAVSQTSEKAGSNASATDPVEAEMTDKAVGDWSGSE
jgi:capsular exopolysaccharide synthesis family protein